MASGSPSSTKKASVLFVCLGNICRSPIAEAVFKQQTATVKKGGVTWTSDSAGTIDYHSGKRPDPRARRVIEKHGIAYQHKARLLLEDDFYTFDYIFGMDQGNVEELMRLKPEDADARIHLLGEFDPTTTLPKEVRDPYYDTENEKGFQDCFDQCSRAIAGFLKTLEKN